MEIVPQPLTKEAFAPFGDVIDVPNEPGRQYYEDALGNLRPARASQPVAQPQGRDARTGRSRPTCWSATNSPPRPSCRSTWRAG